MTLHGAQRLSSMFPERPTLAANMVKVLFDIHMLLHVSCFLTFTALIT